MPMPWCLPVPGDPPMAHAHGVGALPCFAIHALALLPVGDDPPMPDGSNVKSN